MADEDPFDWTVETLLEKIKDDDVTARDLYTWCGLYCSIYLGFKDAPEYFPIVSLDGDTVVIRDLFFNKENVVKAIVSSKTLMDTFEVKAKKLSFLETTSENFLSVYEFGLNDITYSALFDAPNMFGENAEDSLVMISSCQDRAESDIYKFDKLSGISRFFKTDDYPPTGIPPPNPTILGKLVEPLPETIDLDNPPRITIKPLIINGNFQKKSTKNIVADLRGLSLVTFAQGTESDRHRMEALFRQALTLVGAAKSGEDEEYEVAARQVKVNKNGTIKLTYRKTGEFDTTEDVRVQDFLEHEAIRYFVGAPDSPIENARGYLNSGLTVVNAYHYPDTTDDTPIDVQLEDQIGNAIRSLAYLSKNPEAGARAGTKLYAGTLKYAMEDLQRVLFPPEEEESVPGGEGEESVPGSEDEESVPGSEDEGEGEESDESAVSSEGEGAEVDIDELQLEIQGLRAGIREKNQEIEELREELQAKDAELAALQLENFELRKRTTGPGPTPSPRPRPSPRPEPDFELDEKEIHLEQLRKRARRLAKELVVLEKKVKAKPTPSDEASYKAKRQEVARIMEDIISLS